jgi:hypothetical protein
MAKLKLLTQGKHLWVRTIGSTAVGQFVDTIIVMLFVFGGSVGLKTLLTLIGSGYIVKVVYEAAATPLTYLIVNGLKRAEGVEIFDRTTDFNPFAAGPEPPPPGGTVTFTPRIRPRSMPAYKTHPTKQTPAACIVLR